MIKVEDIITVKEAARRLHVTEETIRHGLITKELDFGRAVKGNPSYSYIIPRRRFEMWVSGESMRPVIKSANIKKFKIKNKAANPS